MQLSKKQVNRKLTRSFYQLLYQVIADISQPEEVKDFFKDFLTETELEVLARRLAVACWLDKGRSYQNIKANLAVSSATIATVNDQMKKKGFQLALKKIKAEEWATRWAQKISQTFKRK